MGHLFKGGYRGTELHPTKGILRDFFISRGGFGSLFRYILKNRIVSRSILNSLYWLIDSNAVSKIKNTRHTYAVKSLIFLSEKDKLSPISLSLVDMPTEENMSCIDALNDVIHILIKGQNRHLIKTEV